MTGRGRGGRGGRGGGGVGGAPGGLGGGRHPTGPWGRLKPVTLDPLEVYGLPSKGDNRLLDFKTQERYHTKIIDRYMQFCSQAGRGDELLRRFDSLNLSEKKDTSVNSTHADNTSASSPFAETLDTTAATNLNQNDLSILMTALRKLREGIVASKRIDDFSIQVYIFCVRLALLAKHMETYHPSLLHLLRVMHPCRSLSSLELQEMAGYLILDQACRQGDLAGAYATKNLYRVRDAKVNAALAALAHDNYHLFWKVARSVDAHKARLLEFAAENMRLQALKCLGRTYMSVDLAYLEAATASHWETLVESHQLGWQLEGTKVIIRKPKTR